MSLNSFLQKINNITRGVNNVTRTVSSINASIRAAKSLRDQFKGKKNPRPTVTRTGAVSQPQRKPLGLTPVSNVSSGRNTNKKPVRPAPRTNTQGPTNR